LFKDLIVKEFSEACQHIKNRSEGEASTPEKLFCNFVAGCLEKMTDAEKNDSMTKIFAILMEKRKDQSLSSLLSP